MLSLPDAVSLVLVMQAWTSLGVKFASSPSPELMGVRGLMDVRGQGNSFHLRVKDAAEVGEPDVLGGLAEC